MDAYSDYPGAGERDCASLRSLALVAGGSRWVLAESRPLRLSTLFILYVAQGVPLGLFWFAIPAWMAANGATAADVGYVLGLTALPWTLKLVNGFIMDRYTFLAMGRRRIWIIGAQLVMIALLVACALVGPGVTDILLLGSPASSSTWRQPSRTWRSTGWRSTS